MLPEVAAALDGLDRLAEATPSLRPAAALQGAILRAMCAPPPRVKEVDIPNERAAERLSDGVPLLRNERVPLSAAAIEARMLGICQALRRHQDVAGPAGEIAAAIRGRALDVATLIDAVLGG